MPHENPVLENVFGTIGAILWTIQIIPQIWKSYRTKDTEGLSGILMFTWAVASLFLGTYVVVQGVNIPIIIQPQLFGVLSAISWIQCLYYYHKKSLRLCIALFVGFCVIFGGFETGMYFALKLGEDRGVEGPVMAFGIISAVLLAAALLPQYYEIWKYKEVKGLSITFMIIDIAGGIFCVLSLAFKAEIDGIATANYAAVVILDGIVLGLALLLNPRAKRRRRAEAEADPEKALEQATTVDAPGEQVNPQTAPGAFGRGRRASELSASAVQSGTSTPTLVGRDASASKAKLSGKGP